MMISLKTKIWTILKSRFKKNKNQDWINNRREICFNCPLHSKNIKRLSIGIKIIKLLSDFYSLLVFSNKDNLGHCGVCGCSTYYSTQEETAECSDDNPKWKSIYIPNKK